MTSELVSQITSKLEASDFEGTSPLLAEYFNSLQAELVQSSEEQDCEAFLKNALASMHHWLNLSRVGRAHLNEQLRLHVRDTSYGSSVEVSLTVEFVA